MTRPKKLFITCAVAVTAVGALATPALAGDHSPAAADDRVQTIHTLERNATILPDTIGTHNVNIVAATAS